jgi:hypothetical protein
MHKRVIAFLDVLGMRRALAMGDVSIAERKLRELTKVVEEVLPSYPHVAAHGATDFFLLWSTEEQAEHQTALAACEIFQKYFDLNKKEKIKGVSSAYLLRGGIAYGDVHELKKNDKQLSYSILLGDGLAKAYEVQATRKGMRLFLTSGSSAAFRAIPAENRLSGGWIKVDRQHLIDGSIDYSEVRWVGYGDEVESRVASAARLFRSAISTFRRKEVPEGVVLHYQQTLCATLAGCSSPNLLLQYLVYRHKQKRAHRFLAPIWASAWLRLFRPKHTEFLLAQRERLWERFLIMSGSPMITEVSQTLSRHNRWRPLVRFLRSGKLRFAPRERRLGKSKMHNQ